MRRNSYMLMLASALLSCGGNTPVESKPPAVVSLTAAASIVPLRGSTTIQLRVSNCVGGVISGGRFGDGTTQPSSTDLDTGPLVEPSTVYQYQCTDLNGALKTWSLTITVTLTQPGIGLVAMAQPPVMATLNSSTSFLATPVNQLSCAVLIQPVVNVGDINSLFPSVTGDPCGSFSINWGSTMSQAWTETGGASAWVIVIANGMTGSTPKRDSVVVQMIAPPPSYDSHTPNPIPAGGAMIRVHGQGFVSNNAPGGRVHLDYQGFWGSTIGPFPRKGITNPGQFISPTELVFGLGISGPADSFPLCVHNQSSAGLGGGLVCVTLKIAGGSGSAASLVTPMSDSAFLNLLANVQRSGRSYQLGGDMKSKWIIY